MIGKYKPLLQDVLAKIDRDLSSFRMGRASAGLLEGVSVDISGQRCRLMHVAAITVLDASSLSVKPYDPSTLSLSELDRAIQAANLGVSTTVDADVVRVMVPKATEEDRKRMVKTVKEFGEKTKVAMRSLRKEAMDDLKSMKATISKDEHDKMVKEVEKMIKEFVDKVDQVVKTKEDLIMSFK